MQVGPNWRTVFEAAVESQKPPTATELANRGKKSKPRIDHLRSGEWRRWRQSVIQLWWCLFHHVSGQYAHNVAQDGPVCALM
jgi:hypothetical protein